VRGGRPATLNRCASARPLAPNPARPGPAPPPPLSPPKRYVLAYIESHRGVRRGEKVWQLGFGSGFKCNSAVWVARKRVQDMHPAWEDFDVQVRGSPGFARAGRGAVRGRARRAPGLSAGCHQTAPAAASSPAPTARHIPPTHPAPNPFPPPRPAPPPAAPQVMRDEMDQAEREKAAYLAAKAAAAAKAAK
jgi:hypothetical protein